MICDKCGRNIADDEASCPYCGKDITKNINKYNSKPDTKVTTGDVFKNFIVKSFDANGVACLKEFLIIFIIHTLHNLILGLVGLNYINTIINIIVFIPICTLFVRRYHDTGLSGFFVILYGTALILFSFSFFTEKENLKLLMLISSLVLYVINFLLLIRKTDPNSKWNPYNGYM